MGNSEKRGKSLELELDDRDGIFVFLLMLFMVIFVRYTEADYGYL